jgi:purine-binding chemotaxis protein CheW
MQTPLLDETTRQQSRTGKYLVFHLAQEEFGVHVMKVREIMGLQDITAVPHTPPCVKGVINLRGKVVPVIDLRARFGLAEAEYTQRTCVIVLDLAASAGNARLSMGVIVDGVSEVLNLQESQIEDAPEFGDGAALSYVLGMAKVKDKVKILLDIDRVLNIQEMAGLGSLSS